MTKTLIHPLNQPTPLPWSIASLPWEIVNKYIPRSWTLSSSKQRLLVKGTCQNEDQKSAVVVGLPHNSLKSLLHWRWLNLWLTVQIGISDLVWVRVVDLSGQVVLMQDSWKTIEVGQYFMTKHTDEFWQFAEPITCREFSLPRDGKSSDPKSWIRRNTKIGPVLQVTTSHLQSKYGVEIRIESVNKDNSHSCVRISHGLNKLVTDLIDTENDDNEQETLETKTEVFALKTEVFAYASRSKAIAKTKKTYFCLLISKNSSYPVDYPVAKSLNTLLRLGESLREEDGTIEFWRLKDDLRNNFEYCQCWSDDVWKSKMARSGGNKKIFQYCSDPSRQEVLCFRALQGQSRRKPIDLSLQDNVLIPNNFFENIYHIGCAVSVHSTNSGLIAGGQNSSKENQTVFFTAVKSHA